MDKAPLIRSVIDKLEAQLATMQQASLTSHDAATGSESKSEGKYDTRGLEASYLAEAQADQCQQIAHAIHTLKAFHLDHEYSDSQIRMGSIAEVETNGDISYYFLIPHGGGICVEHAGMEITTATPDTPLYKALIGKHQGDLIDFQSLIILDVI